MVNKLWLDEYLQNCKNGEFGNNDELLANTDKYGFMFKDFKIFLYEPKEEAGEA